MCRLQKEAGLINRPARTTQASGLRPTAQFTARDRRRWESCNGAQSQQRAALPELAAWHEPYHRNHPACAGNPDEPRPRREKIHITSCARSMVQYRHAQHKPRPYSTRANGSAYRETSRTRASCIASLISRTAATCPDAVVHQPLTIAGARPGNRAPTIAMSELSLLMAEPTPTPAAPEARARGAVR